MRVRRDLRKKLKVFKREIYNYKDRSKSLVSQVNKFKGMVIEVRNLERNTRVGAIVGINNYIIDLGKDLERDRD